MNVFDINPELIDHIKIKSKRTADDSDDKPLSEEESGDE